MEKVKALFHEISFQKHNIMKTREDEPRIERSTISRRRTGSNWQWFTPQTRWRKIRLTAVLYVTNGALNRHGRQLQSYPTGDHNMRVDHQKENPDYGFDGTPFKYLLIGIGACLLIRGVLLRKHERQTAVPTKPDSQ